MNDRDAGAPPAGESGRASRVPDQAPDPSWNATAVEHPDAPVTALFAEAVARFSDALAVLAPGEGGVAARLTYAELDRRSEALAAHLRSMVADDDAPTIGVCLDRGPDAIIVVLAVMRIGGVCVPLDPAYPADRLAFMVADADVEAIVTTSDLRGALPSSDVEILLLDALPTMDEPLPPSMTPAPDALAYVLYTSGSSGRPKGVEMPHRALSNLVQWHRAHRDCAPGKRMLQVSPLSFDIAFHEIFATLCTGGVLVLVSEAVRQNALRLAPFIVEHDIEKLYLPFYALQQLVEACAVTGWPCRLTDVFTAGERLQVTPAIRRFFAETGARLHNHYGATEIQDVLARTLPEDPAIWPTLPDVGRPIDNLRVHILDASLKPVPVGVLGEVYIAGAGLARGYRGRLDLDREAFVTLPFEEGPVYRTRDLGSFRPDGVVDILGRADGVVKIRGHRVEPGEVEVALRASAGIVDCAVVARELTPDQLGLVAFVVLDPEVDVDLARLRTRLGDRLPEPMVPAVIAPIDAIPTTPTGKLDRRALPAVDTKAPARPPTLTGSNVEAVIAAAFARALGVEWVDPQANFFDLGGTSLTLVRAHADVQQHLDRTLDPMALFQHPTVHRLARHLSGADTERAAGPRPAARRVTGDIAIIGVGLRLPGADDCDVFWANLRDGICSIRTFDPADDQLTDPIVTGDPAYRRVVSGPDGIELFDAGLFGIPPSEAEIMDPQHRILLEVAWQALEHAGQAPRDVPDRVGVFAGSSYSTYLLNNLMDHFGFDGATPLVETDLLQFRLRVANDRSSLTTNISYRLGLKGPSVNVQTACSTSLVAVHLACQSLLDGACEMALAGGINITVPQRAGYLFQDGMHRSPDGRCRAFDAKAEGTVFGSGAGLVVLRPLEDALAAGDRIIAVIKGTAINNDGADKVGFSAPSVAGQAAVVADALRAAGVEPRSIGYVEAHGTGTPLGDPIEVAALSKAWREVGDEADTQWCALGSVKTNLGHLDECAGVTGLVKAALSLAHQMLPPSLDFETPNPRIDFAGSPFFVNAATRPWPVGPTARRAAVNSLGLGGTNAHAILEEAPAPVDLDRPSLADAIPLLLSGQSPRALEEMAGRWAAWLSERPDAPFDDVRRGAAQRRSHLPCRAAILAADPTERLAALKALADGRSHPRAVTGRAAALDGVVFIVPGQGAQWAGMGQALLKASPVFAQAIADCEQALSPHIEWSLTAALRGEASNLERVDVVQPCLFAMAIGLDAVWRSLGIVPAAVIGHSQGEIAAAVIAGGLSLEDGARVVALRSRLLLDVVGRGGMALVERPVEDVEARICDTGLSVAVVNTATSTVVAGPKGAIDRLLVEAEREGVFCRRIDVDYASHSAEMDPILPALSEALAPIRPRSGAVSMISTVTGKATDHGSLDGEYWCRNLRSPVRLDRALGVAIKHNRVFVELSPHPLLAMPLGQTVGDDGVVVGSLRRGQGHLDDVYRSLAELHVTGFPVDWRAVMGHGPAVELPTYAFQRQRHWLEPRRRLDPGALGLTATEHPLLGAATSLADGSHLATGRLSLSQHPWLGDHRAFETTLMPGTGVLDMVLTAVAETGCPRVGELTLLAPLVIPARGGRAVQVRVDRERDGQRAVTVHSRGDDEHDWTLHAEGYATPARPPEEEAGIPWPPTGEAVEPTALYDTMAAGGLTFGPAFRGLVAAWGTPDALYAHARLAETLSPNGFALHPALLDSSMDALAIWDGDSPALPFEWSDVQIYATGAVAVRARFSRQPNDAVWIETWDDAGRPVLHGRLRQRVATAGGVRQPVADLYAVGWGAVTLPEGDPDHAGWLHIDGRHPDALAGQLARGDGRPTRVVVDATHPADPPLAQAVERCAARALVMVQRILAAPDLLEVPVVWVTRGAVATAPGEQVDGLIHAPLWGLLRSTRAEHPDRILRAVDLGPSDSMHAARAAIAFDAEPEVALRDGEIRAPRLEVAGQRVDALEPPEGDWALDPGQRRGARGIGAISVDLEPGPGEVAVDVRAAGLNFLDVLTAAGILPERPLGLELAGVISAVGDGVEDFEVGQRVMGQGRRAFATRALAPVSELVPLPAGLSFVEAATLPVAALAVMHGLIDLARLRPGERVLIHAATGGVGMVAVQIARHIGAEVFVTASPSKWPTLRAMGFAPDRIASSRTLDFEPAFLSATVGAGVNVVLAALAGDFVDASLRLLPRGGRFIELGKADVRDPERISEVYPGVEYHAVDADAFGPARNADLLRRLVALVEADALRPLPYAVYDLRCARSAFDTMFKARHVGKLVMQPPRQPGPTDLALLTGGGGAIGQALAAHLVEAYGVRRLVLASRRGPRTPGIDRVIAALADAGAEAVAVACDVSAPDEVEALIDRYPPTAVFHLAGVLEDGTVERSTTADFARVLAPKALGAWHLHQATRHLDVSAFVLFSSSAGLTGGAGQANYAAACTFLDALAAHRRARGLAGQSLAWGLWRQDGVGLAGGLSAADLRRLENDGFPAMSTEAGLALLDGAIARPEAMLMPTPLARRRLSARADLPPLWSSLVRRRRSIREASSEPASAEGLASLPAERRIGAARRLVGRATALVLGHADSTELDTAVGFSDMGLDSLMAVELRNRLRVDTGLSLSSTIVFDHPSIDRLAAHLTELVEPAAVAPIQPTTVHRTDEPIAIVGIGLRMPGGVYDLDGLWHLLVRGEDAIGPMPPDRFDLERWYDPDPDVPGRTYTRHGAFVDDVFGFDAAFFGISPREAKFIDPQHRLLLETAWEALERAGIVPSTLSESTTGIYVGIAPTDYGGDLDEIYGTTGRDTSFAAGRLAYTLDTQGPTLSVNTACSASLVALHLAVRALRGGECDLALAGGVKVLWPEDFAAMSSSRALAPDGRSKTFSAAADGFGRGEGAIVLALQRLDLARAEGRPVLGLVRGTAINHDGQSNGITAPNGVSQQRVVRSALADAGLVPGEVHAVETHGTGTRLGDPIEVSALAAVYGTDRAAPLLLGAIKPIVGHLEEAAGLAGVVRGVLTLRHRMWTGTPGVHPLNPHIDWDDLDLLVSEANQPLSPSGPVRIGVSSFGMSGTNAHVILEEAPADVILVSADAIDPPPLDTLPLVLSGRDEAALRAQAGRLAEYMETHPELRAVDVAAGLALHRSGLTHRLGATFAQVSGLAAFAGGGPAPGRVTPAGHRPGKVAALFTGQGSQRPGMGRGLHESFHVFRDTLDAICEAIDPYLERPLRAVMFADAGTAAAALLNRTDFTQPALFALEVAQFRLWQSFGLEPDALLGHSIGELVAAHVSGALSLADAAMLVAARGRLMAALPAGGAMVAVAASEDEVRPLLGDAVCLAAVNGPRAVVLSGDAGAVEAAATTLEADGHRVTRLTVSHAFHSHRLDPMLDDLRAVAEEITVAEPQIPLISNESGAPLTHAELSDPAYWVRQARGAVRFADGMATLAADGITTFVEMGPRGALCATAPAALPDDVVGAFIPTLRAKQPEPAALASALGGAWAAGIDIDWAAFFAPYSTRHVDLPTYAFQRERYWLEARHSTGDMSEIGLSSLDHPLLSAAVELPSGEVVLTGRLSLVRQRWIADYSVAGRVLLPGAALVELALTAGERVGAGGVVELVLTAPLVLTAESTMALRVSVEPEGEGWAVTIHTRRADAEEGAGWTLHAEGRLGEVSQPDVTDLTPWPPAGAEAVSLDGFYAELAEIGFEYGPLFQGLAAAWRGGDVIYGEVRQPALSEAAARFGLHPALFDAALHGSMLGGDDELALPFAWRGVALTAAGATTLRARLTLGDGGLSVALADGTGAPVGVIEALESRAVDASGLSAATRGAAYRVEWAPASAGHAITLDDWAVVGDGFDAIPHRLDDALLAAGMPSPLAGVLIALTPEAEPEAERVRQTTADALELLQRWLADPSLASTRLVFATRGATSTESGEGIADLLHAPLWGLVASAQSEYPERGLGLLDIDEALEAGVLDQALALDEPRIAVRGEQLRVPRLIRPSSSEQPSPQLSGTALITGGTGGLGAALARHLVERHGVERLLLLSRRGEAAPGAAELRAELEAVGASVTVRACDASDGDALRDAIDAIHESHPLRVVVHAAGVLDDGTIASLSGAQVERVMRPKVDAALHLDRLTRGHDLAAFVLFSSGAGVFGSPGQGNYAAANVFLDALAARRRSLGLVAQSQAWGAWDGGMVSALSEADRARLRREGTPLMSLAEGLALFDAALGQPDALTVPMVLDTRAMARAGGEVPPLLRRLVRSRRATARSATSRGAFGERLAALPEGQREAAARQVVAGAAAVVLGHSDPAAVDADAAFGDLGVDSLMAVELRNRLRGETGLELAATVVFDHPTIEALARHLVRCVADDGHRRGDTSRLAPAPAPSPKLHDLCRPAAARPLRLPPWTVRPAAPNDLDRLVELEREAYGWIGEGAIAPPSLISDRIERLNGGGTPWFWVLERGDAVVGWSVLQPTTVDPASYSSWAEATDDGRLRRTFDPEGRYVYLVAGGLAKGVALVGEAILTLQHLTMLRETGHEAVFACSAMPGFRAAHEATGISPEDYVRRTDAAGVPLDPFIALLMSSWPMAPSLRVLRGGYPPDLDSGGHGVSIVWALDDLEAPIADLCDRIARWMSSERLAPAAGHHSAGDR